MAENNFEGQSQLRASDDATQIPALTSGEESVRIGLASLTQLAKTAYRDNRRKYCLALTTAILKIEPSNNDARHLQSLIHLDIKLTLQRLHVLIEDPRWNIDESLRMSAFRVLHNVIDIDPSNASASALLLEIDPPLHLNPSTAPPDASPPRKDKKLSDQLELNRAEFDQAEFAITEDGKPEIRWRRLALFIIPIALVVSAIVLFVSAKVIH
jgi:hypothetical protein